MVVGILQTVLEDTEGKSDRKAVLRKGNRVPVNVMVDQNIKHWLEANGVPSFG